MPNFSISDMAPITLPLDPATTFFETQTEEGGIQVSRKVSASDLGIGGSVISVVGGVNINVDATDPLNPIVNLPAAITAVDVNGVTLNDGGPATNFLNETGNYSVPPGSGQVDSVVGGVNITIDATDPINPIANLDAAITGMTVNGVVLSNAGAATSYLDETGAYSVPPSGGGQVDSVIGGTNISVNAGDPVNPTINLDAAITGVSVDGVTLTTAGAATNYLDETGAYSVPAGAFDPTDDIDFTGACSFTNAAGDLRLGVSTSLFFRNNADTSDVFIQNLGPTFQFGIAGADFGSGVFEIGSSWLKLQVNRSIFFDEKAAQGTPVAGDGEFWVRNDSPNVPMFTDDTGTDFVLNAGGSVPDPLVIGSINLTSSLAVSSLGTPYLNVPINIGANLIGTQGMTQFARQNIQTKPSAFSYNSTLFININGSGTSGSDTIIGGLNSANIEIEFGVAVRLQHGTSSLNVMETITGGIWLPQGSMYMTEKAAAAGDITARGQFWVRNDAPNTPMFTTDTGVDIDLSASGGIVATPTPASGEIAKWDSTGATLAGEPDLFYTGTTLRINNGLGGACLDLRDGNSTGSAANVSLNFTDQVGTVLSTVGDVLGILLLSNPNGQVSLVAGTGGTEKVTMDALSIQLEESAAPGSNNAGYGQYWVRSASPCRPEFRDDTDVNQLLDPSISEIVSVTTSRNLVLTDKGKTIGFTGSTAAQTMTIPANASVAYQIGTVIAFDNSGSVSFTIAITTDTLIFADNNGTGSRVLAAGGYAAAQKVGATTWKISGANIS